MRRSLLPAVLASLLALSAGAPLQEAAAGLQSPKEEVRIAAARALSTNPAPQALQLLIAAARVERSFDVQIALVEALGARRESAARKAVFTGALIGQTVKLRRTALALLPKGDPELLAAAQQTIGNRVAAPHARFRAVEALGRLLPPERQETLRRILEGPDPLLARAAIRACVLAGRREAIPWLVPLLDSKAPDVAPAALDALRGITGERSIRRGVDFVAWWEKERRSPPPAEIVVAYAPVAPQREADRDLLLVFDTTGSFMQIWPEMRRLIGPLVRAFEEKDRTLRVGIIRYKSDNESVPAEVVPFSYDVAGMVRTAENSPLGGFSGALRRAFEKAASDLEWQPERKKTILFLGDIAPVDSEVPLLLALAKDLKRLDEIQTFTIPVFNPGEEHRGLYRRVAEAGGGASLCYRPGFKLFYLNPEGPLDERSKIADPNEAFFRLTACARTSTPAPDASPGAPSPTPGSGRP